MRENKTNYTDKKNSKSKKKTLQLSLNYANNQMMTTQFCKKNLLIIILSGDSRVWMHFRYFF
jgi:hypothetical protein